MKNVKHRKSVSKEKLKVWIDANPNGYMERSLAKIAKEADVSIATVQRNLTKMIAERHGISQDDVSAQRKSAGFTRGNRKKKKSSEKSETSVREGLRTEGNGFVHRQRNEQNPDFSAERKPAESQVSVGSRRVSRLSTDEKKVISGHFDKELYRQLAHLAIDRDSSMQALLVEALNLLFEKEDLPRF